LVVAVPLVRLWNETVRAGVAVPPRPAPLQVPAWMDLGAAPDPFDPEVSCAGWHFEPLTLRIEDGRLIAQPARSQWRPRQDDLPYAVDFTQAIQQQPLVPGQAGEPGRETWATNYAREHAQRLVHPVVDGSLIGFNGGEYGGSLWWYPKNPGRGVKLYAENVQAMVVLPGAVSAVAFVGLSHMGFVRGQALRVARSASDGQWRVTSVHAFRGTPMTYVPAGDGMVVVTTRSVERLPAVGDPVVLFDATPLRLGAPFSLVVTDTDDIAVGMRHFVLLLRPGRHEYTARWYAPMPCGIDPPIADAGSNE
jgi:hypothetical protein